MRWIVALASLAPMGLEWLKRCRRPPAWRDPIGRALRHSGVVPPRVSSSALAAAGTRCLLAAPMQELVYAVFPLLWHATTCGNF